MVALTARHSSEGAGSEGPRLGTREAPGAESAQFPDRKWFGAWLQTGSCGTLVSSTPLSYGLSSRLLTPPQVLLATTAQVNKTPQASTGNALIQGPASTARTARSRTALGRRRRTLPGGRAGALGAQPG